MFLSSLFIWKDKTSVTEEFGGPRNVPWGMTSPDSQGRWMKTFCARSVVGSLRNQFRLHTVNMPSVTPASLSGSHSSRFVLWIVQS
uniref:Uncharacterized protein n=1 Tax=Knipowitschia caucasica TaxID=637954 RepID=A0AAV2LZI8_KNICA